MAQSSSELVPLILHTVIIAQMLCAEGEGMLELSQSSGGFHLGGTAPAPWLPVCSRRY